MLRRNYRQRVSGHGFSGAAAGINWRTQPVRCNKLACADDTLDGRSVPGSFIGASGAIALQQGFPGSDYQHAKELFQLSVASCEKPPGYAAKLDVVDTH